MNWFNDAKALKNNELYKYMGIKTRKVYKYNGITRLIVYKNMGQTLFQLRMTTTETTENNI